MKSSHAGIIVLLAVAVIGGCGAPLKERFYTLSAPEPPVVRALYSVTVGPVSIPDVVDRPQFVLRMAGDQVSIAEQTRWASSLKSEIPRVIAANLAQSLGDAYVSTYPQAAGSVADYRVAVDIQRFESALGDAATIEALWTVVPLKDKTGATRSGRSLAREPAQGPDHDALVAAHGRALASIGRDIAAAVHAARATK